MRITVCWKWVAVDRDGPSTVDPDVRWAGVSLADRAALEVGLRLARRDGRVTVVALAPAAAEATLREAVAVGADDVLRIDASTRLDGRLVAAALAEIAGESDLVITGDQSVDRGTGSVPAFIAAELGRAQALGLVRVDALTEGPDGPAVRVVRRLDGGRREVLDLPLPAVMSVEGAVADMRRASLGASLSSAEARIEVRPGPRGEPIAAEIHPYRPRPRAVHQPRGDTLQRVRDLLHVGSSESRAERVTLEPREAAARIVEQLTAWGYLVRVPHGD